MEGGVHHRANAGLGPALHAHDLLLQLVDRAAPALRRARHHRRGDRRIDEGVGLHHVHARPAERIGELDLGIGAEQRLAGAVGGAHIDHQPCVRRDFDEGAARPVLLTGRRAHADVEPAADAHLHRRVRHCEARRAEPALHVVGGAPRLEHRLAPRMEDAGKPERRRLRGCVRFRLRSLSHRHLLRFPGFSGTRPAGRGGAAIRSAGH